MSKPGLAKLIMDTILGFKPPIIPMKSSRMRTRRERMVKRFFKETTTPDANYKGVYFSSSTFTLEGVSSPLTILLALVAIALMISAIFTMSSVPISSVTLW